MRKIKDNSIVLAIILLSLILILFLQKFGYKSYSRYVSDTLHYNQGIVVEISNENIEYDEGLKLYLGTQDLKVKMTEGNEKGSIIEVTNYLTKTHSVYAKENMRLIINVDTPDDIEPYYTVFNYDRRFSMAACAAILIAAIICISGSKGLKSLAGLLYSMFIIIEFLLPAVFSGWSPTWTSILTAVLSTAVTLLLLNGQSKKTAGAILASTTGVLCSLILFGVMSALIHIDGFCSSDTEGLLLINENTNLQIHDVLFASVLIASLGAIMDVGMSIVSALYEIGIDMIGTRTNTLILAFTGSAFVTLLVFFSYQVQFNQLINSNYLSIEIAQGICGTFGIVLTIPAASGIMALLLTRSRTNKNL